MKRARAFEAFCRDLVVGDDWQVTAGFALVLILTWLLAADGVNAWWLIPLATTLLLARSLRRAIRQKLALMRDEPTPAAPVADSSVSSGFG